MTTTLALEERPGQWEDLLGQPTAVAILTNSLRNRSLRPAYLFEGASGCGKTSAALLLAKRLLCTDPISDTNPCNRCASCRAVEQNNSSNYRYVDGASDRKLDFVRDAIIPFLRAAPVAADWRILVIDEIHRYPEASLSPFLTLLENMPKRSILILCTTDVDDMLRTLVGRCARIHFNRVSFDAIIDKVAAVTGVKDHAILKLLVESCHGSFREVWSVLDVWQQTGQSLTADVILEIMGAVGQTERQQLWLELSKSRIDSAARRWRRWVGNGADPNRAGGQLLEDLLSMASNDPEKTYWQEPLALLSGARLQKNADVWLSILPLLTNRPYTVDWLEEPDTVTLSPAGLRRYLFGGRQ